MGVQWTFEDFFVFFGNQAFSPEHAKRYFPHLEFRSVHQVHGDRVVESLSGELLSADAHYSRDSMLALQIKTADCLPVFIFDIKQKTIMAIHAGWRGVVSQIVAKSLDALRVRGGNPADFHVIIGPHIRRQSFEVDEPVWIQLMDSIPVDFNHQISQYYEGLPNGKYKVSLEEIVFSQIRAMKVPETQIDSLKIDTFSDPTWHSFRRDREQSGRNLSFVVRLTPSR